MIYVGTQYYRAPTPSPEGWERDVKQAKEHGLDYFRFWLMWNWYCQREGQYNFDSLKRLLDICQKHGMKAILLTNLESVPAWLVKKHPEAIYRDAKGGLYMPESVGNTPAGGFPGLCFHHDPIVKYGRDYIETLARTFKDHPAIECWEPHNEPMFEPGRYNDHFYCYCEKSVAKFQEYLAAKYRKIDALNADWRRNYGAFDEVQPPRRRGMYNDWLDWRLFNLDTLIGTLEWRIGAIRKGDPNHYVMMHTRGGSGVTRSLAKEGIDDYRMAALVDKYGTAAFPQCGPEHEYFIAMAGARCASRGKEFWMAELQGGPYGMGVHRNDAEPVCEFCGSSTMEATIDKKEGVFDPGEVTAERLSMWSWSGIAQGAKGVLYWQYRNESFGLEYGFGLTNLDGTPHPRLESVKRFHDVLNKHEALFENAKLPQNEIALVWDPKNDIVNWTAVGCVDAVKNSIKGIHKALWHADYPIDILRLDTDEARPAVGARAVKVDDDFSPYKIVYVPFSPRVSLASVAKLRRYVEQGGTLVAEGSMGQFDDTMGVTSLVPGNGLDALFGCRRLDIRTAPLALMPKLRVGQNTFTTRMHKEVLEAYPGAKVIGRFTTGEPAVVENRVGKGRAIYIGSNPFLSYAVDGDVRLLKWVLSLNKDVARPAWTDKPDVISRVLVSGGSRLVFVLNTLAEPVTATVTVPMAGVGTGKKKPVVTELTEGGKVVSKVEKGLLTIRKKLGVYGVQVYCIEG
jgi:beta-galactosidase GanA